VRKDHFRQSEDPPELQISSIGM